MAVAIAPDGSWLATASQDGSARIWDMATGQQRTVLPKSRNVTAVAIAPDGSWLASGNLDGSVSIWDTVIGQQRATLTGHTGHISTVAIAPDGSTLASAQWGGTVRIWDLPTRRVTALMRVDQPLRDCAWSPSGQSLAAVGDAGVYLFAFNS